MREARAGGARRETDCLRALAGKQPLAAGETVGHASDVAARKVRARLRILDGIRVVRTRVLRVMPIAQGLRRLYGSIDADVARGLALRMDYSSPDQS